jgi:hypothetical protein
VALADQAVYSVSLPASPWDGRPIPDKTLLIHTEQGAGDAIQFARYLPLAAQRCGTLILACPAALMSLLATLPGIAQIRDTGAITVAEFDTYLPLLSLPRVFGTTLATIPAAVLYLDVAALHRRKDLSVLTHLAPSARPRVGLVWAGSSTYQHDRQRSCALQDFAPLLQTPGIAWYSLRTGDCSQELMQLPPNVRVQDLVPSLHDFGDTALLLAQLDLVITVDTAVAHLAGALGKPVWMLLSAVPDWRWGVEGEQTPWYPTMRLFRQARAGDWAAVMQCVAQTLAAWRGRSAEQ